jgi:hypothetical protein
MNTKLILFVNNIRKKAKKKSIFFQLYFANGIFFLFFGFLTGNLFGSFLYIFREFLHWDGAIILFLLCLEELISYFTYNSFNEFSHKQVQAPTLIEQKKSFFFRLKKIIKNKVLTTCPYIIKNEVKSFKKLINQNFFIKILNLFKIGIMLGFFIDAFKVGS